MTDKRAAFWRPRPLTNPVDFSAGFCFADDLSGFSGRHGWRCQGESDFLYVLGGCGEQALAGDGKQAAKARVAMTVQLLGVGEGALNGLLAALVNALATRV